MNVKKLYQREVEADFEMLDYAEVGTEEYRAKVADINELADRIVEMDRIELEREKFEMEKQKQKEEARDRKIKNWITVGTALLAAGITIGTTVAGYRFERTDTLTSKTGNEANRRALNYFFTRK